MCWGQPKREQKKNEAEHTWNGIEWNITHSLDRFFSVERRLVSEIYRTTADNAFVYALRVLLLMPNNSSSFIFRWVSCDLLEAFKHFSVELESCMSHA